MQEVQTVLVYFFRAVAIFSKMKIVYINMILLPDLEMQEVGRSGFHISRS